MSAFNSVPQRRPKRHNPNWAKKGMDAARTVRRARAAEICANREAVARQEREATSAIYIDASERVSVVARWRNGEGQPG